MRLAATGGDDHAEWLVCLAALILSLLVAWVGTPVATHWLGLGLGSVRHTRTTPWYSPSSSPGSVRSR